MNLIATIMYLFIFIGALNSEKYEGLINSKDNRILDYKSKKEFPEEWKLIYKSKEDDYVIFYDIEGNELYFKYRRDKFDRDADYKISGLFKGQAYRIKGTLIGSILRFDVKLNKKIIPPKFIPKDSIEKDNLYHPENIPTFSLLFFESTIFDEVIR
jgi:hypothetical protein